jgi:hypothetical protein
MRADTTMTADAVGERRQRGPDRAAPQAEGRQQHAAYDKHDRADCPQRQQEQADDHCPPADAVGGSGTEQHQRHRSREPCQRRRGILP